MRNAFKPIICAGIAVSGYMSNAQAQNATYASTDILNDAKTFQSIIDNNVADYGKPATTVTAKVNKAFSKSYKNADNVTWYQLNKKYLAVFNWHGLNTHALLGKNGLVLYDLQFGTEGNLPKDIRRALKANYEDFKIGRAVAVNIGGKNVWLVNLQDNDHLVYARIMDGDIDEMARYDSHFPVKKLHRRAHILLPGE